MRAYDAFAVQPTRLPARESERWGASHSTTFTKVDSEGLRYYIGSAFNPTLGGRVTEIPKIAEQI